VAYDDGDADTLGCAALLLAFLLGASCLAAGWLGAKYVKRRDVRKANAQAQADKEKALTLYCEYAASVRCSGGERQVNPPECAGWADRHHPFVCGETQAAPQAPEPCAVEVFETPCGKGKKEVCYQSRASVSCFSTKDAALPTLGGTALEPTP
jgi:hypothetical protein